jgi:hypothetical protein
VHAIPPLGEIPAAVENHIMNEASKQLVTATATLAKRSITAAIGVYTRANVLHSLPIETIAAAGEDEEEEEADIEEGIAFETDGEDEAESESEEEEQEEEELEPDDNSESEEDELSEEEPDNDSAPGDSDAESAESEFLDVDWVEPPTVRLNKQKVKKALKLAMACLEADLPEAHAAKIEFMQRVDAIFERTPGPAGRPRFRFPKGNRTLRLIKLRWEMLW